MFCIKPFWHLLWLVSLIGAFEIQGPPLTQLLATETITFTRHKNDPDAWNWSISHADGSNATILGTTMFSQDKIGSVTEQIPLSGTLIVTAVNPSNSSEIYATSAQFQSADPASSSVGLLQTPAPSAASFAPTGVVGEETSLETSAPSNSTSSTVKSPNIPLIVGAVVAATFVLLTVAAVVFLVIRRRRRRPLTFYRDRMVRQPSPEAPSPSASSFVGLIPPSQAYGQMRQKQRDGPSSTVSFGTRNF